VGRPFPTSCRPLGCRPLPRTGQDIRRQSIHPTDHCCSGPDTNHRCHPQRLPRGFPRRRIQERCAARRKQDGRRQVQRRVMRASVQPKTRRHRSVGDSDRRSPWRVGAPADRKFSKGRWRVKHPCLHARIRCAAQSVTGGGRRFDQNRFGAYPLMRGPRPRCDTDRWSRTAGRFQWVVGHSFDCPPPVARGGAP
jgi:hypothetical protein